MPRTVGEINSELAAKSQAQFAIFEEAGPTVDLSLATALRGLSPEDAAAEVKRRNDELNALGAERDAAVQLKGIADQAAALYRDTHAPVPGGIHHANVDAQSGDPKGRDFAAMMRDNQALARFKGNNYRGSAVLAELSGAEAKTLMSLGTLAPVPVRQPGIREIAQEYRTVRDLFLQGTINAPSFTYLVETTFTNAAAEVTEGSLKPESALAFTETTETVAVIATWLPATRQVLDDLDYLQAYVEGRLRFMVQRREEVEILNGDGIAPNIKGILNRSGIQTYVHTGAPDNNMDAIYKGIVKVRNTAFAEPTAIVLHPNNWQSIRLTKTSTGEYIMGYPIDPNPTPRLWGLEVRETSAIAANTGLVGAFRPDGQVFERTGMTITVSSEHSDFFIRNQVAILCEERLGLAIYRPASFCKITSLT